MTSGGDDSGDRADGERGSYLGFVAHEVRNPLSTALWSAELLSRMAAEERSGARGEKLVAMCLRSLGRVRQLVEDHFLAERLDAGGIPIRREAIAVREALHEAVARRAADAGAVEVGGRADLAIEADRTLLDRALDVLLAAAGREGAPITVEVRADGARAVLGVAGALPAADALADPRKGSASDPKGRALALPLARRIAETLGGTLELVGGGYALVLPLAAARAAGAAPEPGSAP